MVFLFWFVLWFFAMSFFEHLAHRHFMHRKSIVDRWFPRVFESHAVNHHRRYFKIFNFEPDENGRVENIRLSLLPSMPLALIFSGFVFWFSWKASATFLLAILVHHLIWNAIHTEMHNPRQRFFANWGVYKFLARYHLMHHRYPGKNYNVVVPLADFVFGTYIRQSPSDRLSMDEVGLWNPAWGQSPSTIIANARPKAGRDIATPCPDNLLSPIAQTGKA